MTVNYQHVVTESRAELQQRVKERDLLDKRINELRTALRALVKFIPENERMAVMEEVKNAKRRGLSMAESILDLLAKNKELVKSGMTSAEIREGLEESGFDLEDYSQPLAAVMTTLQRLVDQKKVMRGFRTPPQTGKAPTATFKITLLGLSHQKTDGD